MSKQENSSTAPREPEGVDARRVGWLLTVSLAVAGAAVLSMWGLLRAFGPPAPQTPLHTQLIERTDIERSQTAGVLQARQRAALERWHRNADAGVAMLPIETAMDWLADGGAEVLMAEPDAVAPPSTSARSAPDRRASRGGDR